MRASKSSGESSRSVLNAVALQDHLVKTLSLNDPFKKSKSQKPARTKKLSTNANKSNRKLDEEYVIGPKPKALTLAQKLGLVDSPPSQLTDQEWQEVKFKSNKRDDSSDPCVICKEEFGLQDQVLLSCSHVFHRICLEAFEKFSGGKSCPMCRKQEYEKRVIHEGRKLRQKKCATKIQAAWRGYVVRNWYKQFRKNVPPNNPMLRKKYYEEKFSVITERFVNTVNHTEVDMFLAQIDQSVEDSRKVMRLVDDDNFKLPSELQWDQIRRKAEERLPSDCPICFTSFSELRNVQRSMVLLSCSHVFHKNCLEAFEELSLNIADICPVCRSLYYKKVI